MTKNNFSLIVSHLIAANEFKSDQPIGDLLYKEFTEKIRKSFSKIKPVEKVYIVVFYKNGRDIFSIERQSSALKLTFNVKIGALIDRKNLLRDVSKIGHWGNGDYQVKLENSIYFDYCCELIEQIYQN